MDYAALSNLPSLFFSQAAHYGENPFLWAKRDGDWVSMSWSEVAERLCAFAAGLTELGVQPGDRVMLVSENRPEWMVADLAIMSIGAVTVPAYTTNTIEDHEHVCRDSGSKVAIVSNDNLAKTLIPAAERCGVETVISIQPLTKQGSDAVPVRHWDDIASDDIAAKDQVRKTAETLKRDAMCCIIYTSGTGGVPAGVMLSHGAIICNAMSAEDMLTRLPGFEFGKEIFLSFLPLSHSYEHTTGQFVPIAIGAQVYYAESIDKLVQNIGEVRPTIMTAVPRLYETIRGRILRGAEQAGGLKQKLLFKAIDIGKQRYLDPSSISLGDRLLDPLLDKLVRSKVAERFGGRLKTFVSGGAPLNQDIALFFTALGMRILQGYGQTEAAPVISCNYPDRNKLHTVGAPLEGVDLKIAEDGEIIVRGELVMLGYWNQPEKTADTIKDGWLHTGDIGKLDEDGNLLITDRKKDIIVNSGGDNISPQRVEGMLCLAPEIAQAMVQGDKKPYLTALIVPDADWLKSWAEETGADLDGDISQNAELIKVIGAAVDEMNKGVSVIERVRKFALVAEPFSIENHMLTPSMKIRRHIIRAEHGDTLASLYA